MGGKFHLKLNTGERPIANKYREGKMKRTLKRELKVLELAKREALETSPTLCQSPLCGVSGACVPWATRSCVSDASPAVYDAVSVKIHSDGGRRWRER